MAKVNYKLLGEKIKTLREKNGLSREDFAEKTGMPGYQAVSNVENGKRRVNVIELISICKLFGANPDDLLSNTSVKS